MIIKLVGMVIVLASSTLIGFSLAECMASRERELGNISDVLDMMLGQLDYTHTAIRDIFFAVCPLAKGDTRELVEKICSRLEKGETPASAWCSGLETMGRSLSLRMEDVQALCGGAYLLEAYGLEEQKRNLCALKTRTEALLSEASESKRKNSRIVKLLGIYGGILLCIIVF